MRFGAIPNSARGGPTRPPPPLSDRVKRVNVVAGKWGYHVAMSGKQLNQ